MSRIRRVAFAVITVILASATATGLSPSACGSEVGSIDGFGMNNRDFDAGVGTCVAGNGQCSGFSF